MICLMCFLEQAFTHVLKLGLLVVGATTLTDILPPLSRLRGLWITSVIIIRYHSISIAFHSVLFVKGTEEKHGEEDMRVKREDSFEKIMWQTQL